jgi:hypothetical protein
MDGGKQLGSSVFLDSGVTEEEKEGEGQNQSKSLKLET